jgi:hypothetical protein
LIGGVFCSRDVGEAMSVFIDDEDAEILISAGVSKIPNI